MESNFEKKTILPHRRKPVGFTLVELLVVIVILAVLASIAVPSYFYLIKRAEAAECVNRLKGLWTAAGAYIDEHGQWPQVPENIMSQSKESKVWEWWYEQLEPYGVSKEGWLCPTDQKKLEVSHRQDTEFASSYIPTNFDSRRYTPFRWSQPWFTERADFHGDGANVIFSKGDVRKAVASFSFEK